MNDKEKEILKSRAKKLAVQIQQKAVTQNQIELIAFSLDHEKYGIESELAKEVYPIRDIASLPCVPEYFKGLINVRRHILPLIDLKTFFNFNTSNSKPSRTALILQDEEIELAILIDEILGIQKIAESDLKQSIATLTSHKESFFRGITSDQLIVLDGKKCMHNPAFLADEQV